MSSSETGVVATGSAGRVQLVDPRLKPAAHPNTKGPLPKGHFAAACRAVAGDLPDDLGNAPDSARRLIPRSIPPAMT